MVAAPHLMLASACLLIVPVACSADTSSTPVDAAASSGGTSGVGNGGSGAGAWPDASSGGAPDDAGTNDATTSTCATSGAAHYVLDLSLTDAAQITAAVPDALLGGGTFDANGWTPIDRKSDILILPLPQSIDTRRGRVRLDVANLDIDVNADCEEFQLLSFDYRAEPYSHGEPERARFDLLHLGNDDDCNTGGTYREGRFELGGNLRGCTADNDVPCGVNMLTPTDLAIPAAKYSVEVTWNLLDFSLTIWRDGSEVFSESTSAQTGELMEDRMHLILNQCAGGSWPRCGLGPTYPEEAGGMSGTTFSNLKLELLCP